MNASRSESYGIMEYSNCPLSPIKSRPTEYRYLQPQQLGKRQQPDLVLNSPRCGASAAERGAALGETTGLKLGDRLSPVRKRRASFRVNFHRVSGFVSAFVSLLSMMFHISIAVRMSAIKSLYNTARLHPQCSKDEQQHSLSHFPLQQAPTLPLTWVTTNTK